MIRVDWPARRREGRSLVIRRFVAVLATVALLSVAGCGDDKKDSRSDPTPTVSPSPSESKTPEVPVEPEVPAAMDNEDKAGAKAFVEYYWAVVSYAQITGDV